MYHREDVTVKGEIVLITYCLFSSVAIGTDTFRDPGDIFKLRGSSVELGKSCVCIALCSIIAKGTVEPLGVGS